MRIAIDVTGWEDPRGFGRFTRELVRQLVQDCAATDDVVLIANRSMPVRSAFPTGARVRVVEVGRIPQTDSAADGTRRPLALLKLGWQTTRCKPDVVFFPSPATYFHVPGSVPVVVAMHDAMTEEHPERFFHTQRARLLWSAKLWLMTRRATAMVTPSEDARQRIATALRWPLNRITCIHEAPAAIFGQGSAHADAIAATLARHRLPVGIPLVLYVGGMDPHKNLGNLLRAMARIHPERANAWHLALVGSHHASRGAKYLEEIRTLRDTLGLEKRVTLTGFIPDEELVHVYHAAEVLVLPSLDEGFGLPVVEAMACGLPVAVSDRGPLPSLAGDAGLTFDPEDPADMARTIGAMLDDPESKHRYGERGVARAKSYTWQRSAAQLTDVLRAVARSDA